MSPFVRFALVACFLAPALASAQNVQIFEHANYQGRSAGFGEGRYDINQLRIGNDVLSSVRVPSGWSVTLYEHANYQGRQLVLNADTPYVGDSWNDQTSSLLVTRLRPGVVIYEHANYEGRSASFGQGRFDINQLGIGNDVLSSVRVPRGWMVTLYEHANFQGRQLVLTADTAFVGDGWNDLCSSLVVSRSRPGATIFEHANYEGASKSFAPGRYNMGDLGIGNDVLSSLRVARGVRVVLYEHANFEGRSRVITSDTPWIGDEWNDMVSSLEVMGR